MLRYASARALALGGLRREQLSAEAGRAFGGGSYRFGAFSGGTLLCVSTRRRPRVHDNVLLRSECPYGGLEGFLLPQKPARPETSGSRVIPIFSLDMPRLIRAFSCVVLVDGVVIVIGRAEVYGRGPGAITQRNLKSFIVFT